MATYQVIQPGFFNNVLHHPDDPDHNQVTVDKKFKDCPSWLKLVKKSEPTEDTRSPQQKAADTRKANKKAREANKTEVDSVTFTEDPNLSGPTVL